VSEDDLEVVFAQFDAVNRRDFARAMELYDEDVVLIVPPVSPGEGNVFEAGRFEGKEAVGRWFGNWFQAFDADYRFDIEETEDLGHAIYLFARHRGRGRASGVEVHGENAYLYRVRNGKVVRIGFFAGREQAMTAAALPEWSAGETD
jgi:ketosteroid isomerase-like protein